MFKFTESCRYWLVFVDWPREDNTDCCLVRCLISQVEKNINNMTIKMPHQLFLNGEFVDAEGGKTYKTINPTDGTVRTKRKKKESRFYSQSSAGSVILRPDLH